MALRPYQTDLLTKSLTRYKAGVNKQLLTLPTGMGKTVCLANLSSHHGFTGKTLVVVHREELADQTAEKMLHWNPGMQVGIEMGDRHSSPYDQTVVASVQTLSVSDKRLAKISPEDYSLLIIDECHHSTSDSYKKIISHFGLLDEGNTDRLLAGFTATVNRSDGTPMGSVYDEIVFSYDIKDAIDDGWLVAIKGIRVKTDVDISKVATVAGDLAAGQLAQTVNTPQRNGLIVEEWVREAYPRQTVAFCVDVQHSKDLCTAFQQKGVPSAAIWGGDPDRRAKLEAFRQGHLKVLCNCQILTEGFDMWQVACVIMACPTKSQAKFIQCTGRGSRLQEGIDNLVQWRKEGKLKPGDKEDLLLIDVCDVTGRHSLVTLPSLFGLGPKLDLNGTSVMVAVKAIEEAQLKNPDLDLTQLDDIRNLKSFVETVNLWSVSFCSEIADVSELCWHKFLDNSYRLLMPGRESLTITGDLLGQYAVKGTILGERIEMKGFTSLSDALAFAEHNVSTKGKSILTLLRREAAWHKQPISPALLKQLRGFKMPESEIAKHNKGSASRWVTKKFGERRR